MIDKQTGADISHADYVAKCEALRQSFAIPMFVGFRELNEAYRKRQGEIFVELIQKMAAQPLNQPEENAK